MRGGSWRTRERKQNEEREQRDEGKKGTKERKKVRNETGWKRKGDGRNEVVAGKKEKDD